MKQLLQALVDEYDECEGWIRIVRADWKEHDLTLTVSVSFHDEHAAELWEIVCSGTVEESFCSNGAVGISVSTDLPLLKPYVEPEVDLTFSDNAIEPETLFGILCSCCIEVIGRPESIARFLNGAPRASGISSSRYGLLGRFPQSLARHIQSALKDLPITTSALPGRTPARWDGTEYLGYGPLQVLEIGRSYIIAKTFNARRAQEPSQPPCVEVGPVV